MFLTLPQEFSVTAAAESADFALGLRLLVTLLLWVGISGKGRIGRCRLAQTDGIYLGIEHHTHIMYGRMCAS